MADPATSTAAQAPASSPSAASAAETPATAETSPAAQTPADAEATPATPDAPAGTEPSDAEPRTPGFSERGRMRRRLRFLRKARELAYRDLGGLIFEMHRLGERHDELASAKLATLSAIDGELRALEQALADRRPVTVLREAGIAACPRCAAIHGSEDRFCPACGTPMDRRADRPIATAGAPAATTGTPHQPLPAPAPKPAPAPIPPKPASTAKPAPATKPAPTAKSAPAAKPAAAPTAPATTPASGSASTPPPAVKPTEARPTAKPTDDRPTEIIRPSDIDKDESP